MSSAPTDTHKTFLADGAHGWPFASADRPGKTQRYRKGFRSGQGEARRLSFPVPCWSSGACSTPA